MKTNVCNGMAIEPNYDRVITKELKKEDPTSHACCVPKKKN